MRERDKDIELARIRQDSSYTEEKEHSQKNTLHLTLEYIELRRF